jgi:hypothetical protein
MRKPILAALGLVTLAVSATPALATPRCDSQDSVTASIEIGTNGRRFLDTTDQFETYKMLLNQQGVAATRVEKWNGCLRAFVTQPGGGEVMQFFDPQTLRQVF